MSYRIKIVLMLTIFSLPILLAGCASMGSGTSVPVEEDSSVHQQLMGKDKASIIKVLGDPDFVTFEGEREFWGFHNSRRWYLDLHYLSGGKAEAKDLVVELSENRARDAYLVDKGSSVGVLTLPMSQPD